MSKYSNKSFNSTKSAIQPFLWAMFFVIGIHFVQNSNFQEEKIEGTFYEITSSKISSPSLSHHNLHLSDFGTCEAEENEEKSETNLDYVTEDSKTILIAGFFQISGASIKSLKIPFKEGKAPLYILFKNFRVHLA